MDEASLAALLWLAPGGVGLVAGCAVLADVLVDARSVHRQHAVRVLQARVHSNVRREAVRLVGILAYLALGIYLRVFDQPTISPGGHLSHKSWALTIGALVMGGSISANALLDLIGRYQQKRRLQAPS